jgi:hypothetical protein
MPSRRRIAIRRFDRRSSRHRWPHGLCGGPEVAERLAPYMVAARDQQLPEQVLRECKHRISRMRLGHRLEIVGLVGMPTHGIFQRSIDGRGPEVGADHGGLAGRSSTSRNIRRARRKTR